MILLLYLSDLPSTISEAAIYPILNAACARRFLPLTSPGTYTFFKLDCIFSLATTFPSEISRFTSFNAVKSASLVVTKITLALATSSEPANTFSPEISVISLPKINLIPDFSKDLIKIEETSESTTSIADSFLSTTVTLLPNELNIWAISTPI